VVGSTPRGQDRITHLVDALWDWKHEIEKEGENGAGQITHGLALGLVSRVMTTVGGLRVGDTTLEPREVKGSGHFSIVLSARLAGAGAGAEEEEDVAVKVFVGRGAQEAFETELNNLKTLTDKISPAALVVRLVGVMETREGQALPWPALVMTPLCEESLEQRIDRFDQEAYTLQDAVAWAVQVALSLHCLHRESRLRHGDVTLRNVLLGRDGRAYVADVAGRGRA
jgi:hypothetical protein